jgi:hypothetical protein
MSEGHSGVHGSVPSDGLGERSRPRRRARRFPTALVVVALAGVAVGVGGTLLLPRFLELLPVPAGSSPTPTPPSATTSASATPGGAGSGQPRASSAALTPPATTLALGKTATVTLSLPGGHSAVITLTPLAPVVASPENTEALRKVLPQLAGMRVYFTQVQVSKVAGDRVAETDLAPVLQSITRDGAVVPSLAIARWTPCGALTLGAQLDATVGATQVTQTLCLASAGSAAPEGLVPTGLRFAQPGGLYDPPASGVTWMP